MTNEEIIAIQAEMRRWASTSAGGLFMKFERLLTSAVLADCNERITDRALTDAWAKADAVREEVKAEIKRLQAAETGARRGALYEALSVCDITAPTGEGKYSQGFIACRETCRKKIEALISPTTMEQST